LALGEPSANLPENLLNNLKINIGEQKFGYTESIGTLELRKKVSEHYKKNYNSDISIENVAITSGASAGIFMSLLCLFERESVIAITRPSYPAYRNIIKALDLKVYYIDTYEENKFQLEASSVKELPNSVKGIILSSPSNPCGSIILDDVMINILEICKSKNIKVISDEIYHKVEYQSKKLNTAFNLDHNSIVINSFSKYFLMTGYRLGWIIGDKNFINKIRNLSMNFYLSPSSISQFVAKHVFNYYDYFDSVVSEYLDNRNYLINKLKGIGLTNILVPEGAFYLYVNISNINNNSYEFCRKMVSDIGVTLAPGIDFDDKSGKKYVRFSYSCKKKELEESLKLIDRWL
tara:strand:- start:247 stop:1290 length:1044 start_codon:yes stop_codon:yes gene_type:complete